MSNTAAETQPAAPAPAGEQSPPSFDDVQCYASPPNPPELGDPTPTKSIDNVVPKEKIQKGLAVAGTAIGTAWKWTRTKTDEVGKNINQKLTELPETEVGKQVNRRLSNAAVGLNNAGQRIAQTTSVVGENVQKGAVNARQNVVTTSKNVGVTVGNVVNDVKNNPAVANATQRIGRVAGNLLKRNTGADGQVPPPTGTSVSSAAMESSAAADDDQKRMA